MAIGAKPAGALPCVEPLMTNSNIAVIATSHTSTDFATTYGTRSLVGNRPPAHSPKLTAGFRWQPEMWPMA